MKVGLAFLQTSADYREKSARPLEFKHHICFRNLNPSVLLLLLSKTHKYYVADGLASRRLIKCNANHNDIWPRKSFLARCLSLHDWFRCWNGKTPHARTRESALIIQFHSSRFSYIANNAMKYDQAAAAPTEAHLPELACGWSLALSRYQSSLIERYSNDRRLVATSHTKAPKNTQNHAEPLEGTIMVAFETWFCSSR